jgi:hypothetical protein
MSDEFQYWRDALAGKDVAIHADKPQPGYYRMRDGKNGPYVPVAIWHKDGDLVCRVANSKRDALDVWTSCASNPVAKEAAKHAFDTGTWPSDAPESGHNSGDVSLAEQIKDYAAQALSWLRQSGIMDANSKDMAANYRARLLELKKEADAARETEKKPHDLAAKAVQAKYKPMIEEADAAAEEIRSALTVFMRDEERKEREAREKAWREEQERVAAERARIEAERAEKLAKDPVAALTESEPELPMAPSAPEPVRVQAGGQRGRKTGLRTVTKYVVTDHEAALAFFAKSEDVRELVQKLAERAAKAGVTVPGVEKQEEKVAA